MKIVVALLSGHGGIPGRKVSALAASYEPEMVFAAVREYMLEYPPHGGATDRAAVLFRGAWARVTHGVLGGKDNIDPRTEPIGVGSSFRQARVYPVANDAPTLVFIDIVEQELSVP